MENASLSFGNKEQGRNKRRHDRVAVSVPVRYKVINRKVVKELVDPRQVFEDGHSVNISLGGVSLATKAVLSKGDYLKLEITLPRAERVTRALAEVMWCGPNPGGSDQLAGIRFLIILNEADEHSIKRFLQTISQ